MELKTNFNEIAKELHSYAVDKGFWSEKREVGTLLMLIVSELSEALEADRKGKRANLKEFHKSFNEYLCGGAEKRFGEHTTDKRFGICFREDVKDTFEDEIADSIIRLLDLVGYMNIDIDKHIELKMKYNQSRPYMHGKKY